MQVMARGQRIGAPLLPARLCVVKNGKGAGILSGEVPVNPQYPTYVFGIMIYEIGSILSREWRFYLFFRYGTIFIGPAVFVHQKLVHEKKHVQKSRVQSHAGGVVHVNQKS